MTPATTITRAPVATETRRTETSLDASDEFDELDANSRYCPTQLLARFTLLMAGHGCRVRPNLMLGDRNYAMWQLARAHAVPDDSLRAVVFKLFAYFDRLAGRNIAG